MLTWDAVAGRMRAGLKSFYTLDRTATAPTPISAQKKFISLPMSARGRNKYSIMLKTPLLSMNEPCKSSEDLFKRKQSKSPVARIFERLFEYFTLFSSCYMYKLNSFSFTLISCITIFKRTKNGKKIPSVEHEFV